MQSFGKFIKTAALRRSANPQLTKAVIRMNHHNHDCEESVWDHEVKARITLPAPHFAGMAWVKDGFKKISLDDYKGKYLVLFFYPLDFTFVCPTEIKQFQD
jgi:hypothetical protein